MYPSKFTHAFAQPFTTLAVVVVTDPLLMFVTVRVDMLWSFQRKTAMFTMDVVLRVVPFDVV